MINQLVWSLPTELSHNVCGSTDTLSFVGGAGDFDAKGIIRNPGDIIAQIRGTVENIAIALSQENCTLADAVRLKVFYTPSEICDEITLINELQEIFPKDPSPVISTLPVPLQPFQGQEVQIQVIAARGWRARGDFQFASQPLEVPGDESSKRPLVTTSLRAGEFIAVSNRTAAHFNRKSDTSLDGPGQSHIIMPSLQK